MSDAGDIIVDGLLEKKGHFRRSWQRRYFVLTSSQFMYYRLSSAKPEGIRDNSLLRKSMEVSDIVDVKNAPHHTRKNVFKIVHYNKKDDKYTDYLFDAFSDTEKSKWMRAINSLIRKDTNDADKKEKFESAMKGLKIEAPELHQAIENFLASNSQPEILDILAVFRQVTIEVMPKNELARKTVSLAAERKIRLHPDLWTPQVKTAYASLMWDYKVSERDQERRAKFLAENASRLQKEKGLASGQNNPVQPTVSGVQVQLGDIKLGESSQAPTAPSASSTTLPPAPPPKSEGGGTKAVPNAESSPMGPNIPEHKPGQTCRSVYKLGNTLGSGASSIVRAGKHIASSQQVAIKCIQRKGLKPAEEQALQQEVQIMKKLRHPNLVRLIDYFQEPEWHYLVTPMCTGGELFDELVKREYYNEDDARIVIRKLASAITYLHSQGIVHRDIKPENILLATKDPDSDIVIADFGFAKSLEKNQQGTACGTPGYIAPEIVRGKAYGPVVDCWSIGVVLYILLCGYPPFPGDNHAEILKRVATGQFQFDSPYWDEVSDPAKDLVQKLLTLDPEKRIKAAEILEHPWIKAEEKRNLSNVLSEMRKFSAKEKFRAGIQTVRSAIRMKKMMRASRADMDGMTSPSENESSPMSEAQEGDSPSRAAVAAIESPSS